jgi:formate hydrogenlyase subunit 6/NADH:ubiquinone oxidoreductase subunit I
VARFRIPLLPQLIRTFFRRPETVKFPFGPADISPEFRGRVTIHEENCRGCSLCVRDCPTGALELFKESREEYRLEYRPDRCAYCGQCELSCNFDAIYLISKYVPATPDRESLKVTLVDRKADEEKQQR